ncbi:methyltransferase domain-containing protein [Ectothiorhodospiraceae bacterium WFHF3C12]|nr:methyltransferase domain-containing protein [Ectothiorhodospiraceae bacterium WFHF3C12]
MPIWLKRRLRFYARQLVGLDYAAPALHERDQAVYQVFDQRANAVEQLCFDKVNALEEKMEERQQNLMDRFDAVSALLESRWSGVESSLLSRYHQIVEDIDKSVSAAPESFSNNVNEPVNEALSDEAYSRLQEVCHDGADRAEEREAFYQRLVEQNLPNTGGSLLDLGCGGGELLATAQESGFQVLGVDHNTKAAVDAERRGVHVAVADLLDFLSEQPTGSRDAITSLHVIEHLPITVLLGVFRECSRVLRPNGVVVLDTPKIASLYTLSQYYFSDPTHKMPRHHSLYAFLLAECGFEDIQVDDLVGAADESKLDLESLRSDVSKAFESGSVSETEQNLWEDIVKRLDILNEWLFVGRDVRIVARNRGASDE